MLSAKGLSAQMDSHARLYLARNDEEVVVHHCEVCEASRSNLLWAVGTDNAERWVFESWFFIQHLLA